MVEQGWYLVGGPGRGASPAPSYPYRRFSEASIWGGDSYPGTTRTSFSSSGGRGASVPPAMLNNNMDMPLMPPPPQQSTFHSPMQYLFLDETPFNTNEAMATPNPYISDDTSGYRFPSGPERPPRSQHHPSYHQLQHAHTVIPVDSSIYGVYQY
jgi:hypothetical protein